MAIALAVPSVPCAGQGDVVVLKPTSDTPDAEGVWVRMQGFAPGGRRGGYGWASLDIHNRHADAHEVTIALEDRATKGQRVAVRHRLIVEPTAKQRVTLPIPAAGLAMTLHLDLAGPLPARVSGSMPVAPPSGAGVTVLSVGFGDDARDAWTALRAFDGPTYRKSGVRTLSCVSADLPATWTLLTAFDVIAVDCENPDLTLAAQALLVDYAAGGGRLVLIAPERLPRTALRALVDGAKTPFVRHGFGSIGIYPRDLGEPAGATRRTELALWLTNAEYDIAPWLMDKTSGPVPSRFHQPVRVPGVSRIPTNLFFLITVLFVLFAGPVNHIWFRQRGRPWIVLLTVPIAGFLVTGLIIGYSLMREGLGTQGVVFTASYLDQGSHRVAGFATRTVFAGVSPAEVRPDSGTYLFSHDVLSAQAAAGGGVPGLVIDLQKGAFDGSMVPSRRPTGLVSLVNRPCRERIRFSRRSDGSLEVLDGRGLPVLRKTDALVLHDFDGKWHTMRSDGVLLPVPEAEGTRAAGLALAPFRWSRPRKPRAGRYSSLPEVTYIMQTQHWLEARLISHLQKPGTYCALVRRAPGFDDLEVPVAWSDEVHLVVGILAPGDIVP